MLFHTWVFLIFFVVVYPVYLLLRYTKHYNVWLLLASYVFYGWWNPLYLLLIVYSTLVDYFAVNHMAAGGRRKLWLWVSIANNLFLLGFFKYAGFVTENINALLAGLNIGYQVPAPGVLLPVGISFYTFQSMSYTIDYYRGKIKREPSLLRFATFVSLFPQLVAGPIERAKHLLPQLRNLPPIHARDVTEGLSLFVVGLFKKLAVANYLALYVDRVYAAPEMFSGGTLFWATFAFGWQIYYDFSGYTDMARGVARMMGFNLMLNFNNPYLATGLGDFWSRWHISLSTWFKDYVYIPLGGNRGGTVNTYVNMALTMLISGLWHGAGWTFIIWGALHAVGRMGTRELERAAAYREHVPRFVKQILVFLFVTFTWAFFRADNLGDACTVTTRIFTFAGGMSQALPVLAFTLTFGIWAYQFLYESRGKWLLDTAPVRVALMTGMLLYMAVFSAGGEQPFIYFQF